MRYIDLRSDTVTQPTEKMRFEIAKAIVGDDVYGEDKTVTQLEDFAAQLVGKDAALFVPSGTMGNQIAIMVHTKRGDEIILDENYHIFQHEVGAAALLSGVNIRTIKSAKGIMEPQEVLAAIRGKNIHYPDTGLICMENANSLGIVVPLDNMEAIYALAGERSIPVHLDGARIFNAAIALGCDVKEITNYCDTVMFCLSKGLCAPVGSILAGDKQFIEKAKKVRKLLGGGLRQAGFLAAAGMVALTEMVNRLEDDHENARLLAAELANIEGIDINPAYVHINMLFFKINKPDLDAKTFVQSLLDKNIKINGPEGNVFRFVTNNDVNKSDIVYIIQSIKECI